MKFTPEDAQAISDAIKNGTAIVCYSKCWPCMLGQCPGGVHPWADTEDIEHAANTGQEDPSAGVCGCPCVDEAPIEHEPDRELPRVDFGGACPLCGEAGACGYDTEGRPLIHAIDDEDDQ